MMLFYWHIGMIWHSNDWGFLFCLTQVLLDFFGPVMFIMMSCVGTMISQAHQQQRLALAGNPKNGLGGIFTSDSLFKTAYLFAVAEVLNFFNFWNMGPYFFFGMSVVLFIAFYHLLTPVLMRIGWKWKLLAVAALALAYEPLFFWCYGGIVDHGINLFHYSVWAAPGDARVLVYFLLFDIRLEPLFSWSILALLTSIVFDGFSKAYRSGDRRTVLTELKKVQAAGFACIAIGILASFPIDHSYAFLPLTVQVYDHIDTILPIFLIRHTPQYQFYCFGIICLVFCLVCKKHVISEVRFPWEEKFNTFGRMSLTVYIISFFAFAVNQVQMSLLEYSAFFAVFIVLVINLFWKWETVLGKVGSLEWLRDRFVSLAKRVQCLLADSLREREATGGRSNGECE